MRHGLGLLLLAGLTCACTQKPEECKSWASDSTGAGWSQCGDTKERKLECPPSTIAGQPQMCTCEVNGTKGNTFTLDDPSTLGTLDSSTKIANQNCGWKITR
jgi:hypothetical protein